MEKSSNFNIGMKTKTHANTSFYCIMKVRLNCMQVLLGAADE